MSISSSEAFSRPLRLPVLDALKKGVGGVLEEHIPADVEKLLEVGCGNGFFYLSLLPDLFKKAYRGVDEHPPSYKEFQQLAPEANIDYARLPKLRDDPGSVDVVVGFSAYSFLRDLPALNSIHDVLRPGGKIILFQDSGLYDPNTPPEKRNAYTEMQNVERAHTTLMDFLRIAQFNIVSGHDLLETAVISDRREMMNRISETSVREQLPPTRTLVAFTCDRGINRIHHSNSKGIHQKLEEVKVELGSPRSLEMVKFEGEQQVLQYIRIPFLVAEKPRS